MDDRAEPGRRASGVSAEIADDPVELALLEGVQSRRRHAHVLDREIAQRSARGRRRDAEPLARRGTGHAGVGEDRELLRRPLRPRPRGRLGQRAAMLRHQTAQRQRVIDRVPLGVGQELEEDTRTGVVVVDRGHEHAGGRPRQRACQEPELVVHRGPAPVEGRRGTRVDAGGGIRESPRIQERAAQPRIRPDPVLDAGDHDGVELGAERAGGREDAHRLAARRARRGGLRRPRCRGCCARTRADRRRASARRSAWPPGTARRPRRGRDAPDRRADRDRGRVRTTAAPVRCGPTRSRAARARSRRGRARRRAPPASGRSTAARRASRVSMRSNSSGRRMADTSSSRPERSPPAASSMWRSAERSRRSSTGSRRPPVPTSASATSSKVQSSRAARSMMRSRSRTGARVPRGRPGPLDRVGTSRAASSASRAVT